MTLILKVCRCPPSWMCVEWKHGGRNEITGSSQIYFITNNITITGWQTTGGPWRSDHIWHWIYEVKKDITDIEVMSVAFCAHWCWLMSQHCLKWRFQWRPGNYIRKCFEMLKHMWRLWCCCSCSEVMAHTWMKTDSQHQLLEKWSEWINSSAWNLWRPGEYQTQHSVTCFTDLCGTSHCFCPFRFNGEVGDVIVGRVTEVCSVDWCDVGLFVCLFVWLFVCEPLLKFLL